MKEKHLRETVKTYDGNCHVIIPVAIHSDKNFAVPELGTGVYVKYYNDIYYTKVIAVGVKVFTVDLAEYRDGLQYYSGFGVSWFKTLEDAQACIIDSHERDCSIPKGYRFGWIDYSKDEEYPFCGHYVFNDDDDELRFNNSKVFIKGE